MKKFLITEQIIEAAQIKADLLGSLHYSVLHGNGNLQGFIAEIIIENYCLQKDIPVETVSELDKYDYDFIIDGKKTDIKCNKYGTKPKKWYSAEIYESSLHQETDQYIFCHINDNLSLCWIIGMISKENFMHQAEYRTRGSIHPYNDKYVLKANSYSLEYAQVAQYPFHNP